MDPLMVVRIHQGQLDLQNLLKLLLQFPRNRVPNTCPLYGKGILRMSPPHAQRNVIPIPSASFISRQLLRYGHQYHQEVRQVVLLSLLGQFGESPLPRALNDTSVRHPHESGSQIHPLPRWAALMAEPLVRSTGNRRRS